MEALLSAKNKVRDFYRKYDEYFTPILRLVGTFIIFLSISNLFGYYELFNQKLVIALLAILCAVLPDAFLVFAAGAVMTVDCFAAHWEIGATFFVLFVAMYCMYIKFFPKYAFVMLLIPICYQLNLIYLVPIIVAMIAGIFGIVPMAFGTVIYYFSIAAAEAAKTLSTATDMSEVKALAYIVDKLVKNEDMFIVILIFAVTILVTSLLYHMSYDYAWYIAIGVGGLINIIVFFAAGYVMDYSFEAGSVILGTLFGVIVALIVQFFKGIVGYKRTEVVQYEDDEYYYYVKAIPKLDAPSRFKIGAPKAAPKKKKRPVANEEEYAEPEMLPEEEMDPSQQ